MFGYRSPVKKVLNNTVTDPQQSPELTMKAGPSHVPTQPSKVRRSVGEWEAGKTEAQNKPKITPKKVEPAVVGLPKPKPKLANSQESRAGVQSLTFEVAKSPVKYADRLVEARACVTKAKINLGQSRNIKGEIKLEVLQAIDRLYQLVKEVHSIKGQGKKQVLDSLDQEKEKVPEREKGKEETELLSRMEEHAHLIRENNSRMEKLKETIEKQQEFQERQTYASVAAAFTRRQSPEQTALHSVVVTSKDETETGEEVLERIRKAVNAKEGGVTVDRVRKAKDRKVIVGCKTEEEREKIKERLKREEKHLNVEEMKNKDPLVILRDVFKYNSDEDVLSALRNQNKHIILDGKKEDSKLEIAYKKHTRNPLTNHVILRVSPKIWQRIVEAGSVLIDLQRVRVADQSPLVQCSLCLGYGHGRRFCKETIEKCSHCGGPHLKTNCADWLAGVAPVCCNCTHAKMNKVDHSAFSQECTIRRKWEALARATIAYC